MVHWATYKTAMCASRVLGSIISGLRLNMADHFYGRCHFSNKKKPLKQSHPLRECRSGMGRLP
ncbi:hypothetical protein [Zooshikella harenae]|uniref:Uncharacterized protein n=1 Tax=Zooshikella harenae TaxID=2827238 RepID=A0ABS5ZDF0_9GAMM|nr:hypothetical protein [Zooshikella harenae]MBU2710967.1 hypothetical protein [Zooshikella harenae]